MVSRRGFPAGPVILIGFGVLFLMNTMDILRFDRMIRYWPVLLIVWKNISSPEISTIMKERSVSKPMATSADFRMSFSRSFADPPSTK